MFGVFLGLLWLSIFVASHHWPAAIVLATLGILAIPCWLVARSGKFSLGLMLAQIICLTYTVWFSLVFDIPSAAIPRTAHLYLLVIAMVGFVNYRREPCLLQVPIIVASLVAFIAVAAVNPSLGIAMPMSESVRFAGAWINASVSICMLGACIVAMQIDLSRSTDIASELEKALWKRQFRLVYQPQVDAEGKVLGAEVLLRWTHPKRGEVPPAEFIPLAERVGFMPQLGTWIIAEACRTLADWHADESKRALTLSINVTADQFVQTDFYDVLQQAVVGNGIRPERLKLELTESVFVNDVDAIVTKLSLLRRAGFAISLDDFGTGYSSLSYLRQLPLNQIKVDRSFVRGVAESRRAAALAKTIVQIGHDLGLDVLAEGIETEEQHRIMLAYGCTGFQGFHFGRPMPLPAFEQWLADAQRAAPQARVPAMA